MIALWLASAAFGADLGRLGGSWALDPARSDDPSELLYRLARSPAVQGGAASRYSPDQGTDQGEAERERAARTVNEMLGISSRVDLAGTDDGVTITFGGEVPVEVSIGRKWKKVKRDDRDNYKIRAQQDGPHLVLERRFRSNILTETFLAPGSEATDRVYVVVRLDATGLASGFEFRRAYAPLHQARAEPAALTGE